MNLIEARGLAIRFGGREVLQHVTLDIHPGEIVTVVGPNGSGKSTLLRALVGAIRPDAGEVRRAPGLRVGYVPQRLHIDPSLPMTVRRFLDLPNRVSDAEAHAALSQGDVGSLWHQPLASLSGGQFQRVLLARAILGRPQVLMLDEATQGLDQPGEAAFYRQIEAIRDQIGCAVVMVSHELHVVMSASDRVICLNGHVCCEGTPAVVSAAPEYRALFGTGTGGALALYRHQHDHDHSGHVHDGHDHDAHDHDHHHHDHKAHDHA